MSKRERAPAAFVGLESLLRAKYPTLHAFIVNGECRIRGTFAAVETDRYALDIALPANYPHALSLVWETGGRIPRELDRHVFGDGSLCLGAPLALWIQLEGDYSVGRLIDGVDPRHSQRAVLDAQIMVHHNDALDLAAIHFPDPVLPGVKPIALGTGQVLDEVLVLGYPNVPGFAELLAAEKAAISSRLTVTKGAVASEASELFAKPACS